MGGSARKDPSGTSAFSDGGGGVLRLAHPAFAGPVQWDGGDGATRALRAVSNLRGEDAVLAFALGLFSALAFLEAEGWPWRPDPADWALGNDDLPRLRTRRSESETEPSRGHAALIYKLLGGTALREGQPLGSLPRRNRRLARWNAWMAGALGEGSSPQTCRNLLHGLMDVGDGQVRLPARWGIGCLWESTLPPSGEHAQVFGMPHVTGLEACLCHCLEPGPAAPPPLAVFVGEAPPYALAGLEPVAAAVLGSKEEGRRWIRTSLAGGREGLGASLAALLEERARGGVVVWPALAMDDESRAVLKEAVILLGVPLRMLDPQGECSAGRTRRLHLLWLTPTGSEWYLENARLVSGATFDGVLEELESMPPGEPGPGSPIIPPMQVGSTGRVHPDEHAPAGPIPTAAASDAERYTLYRVGRWPDLWAWTRERRTVAPVEAAFWRALLLAEMGQAGAALTLLESIPAGAFPDGRVALCGARALERLMDYGGALRMVEEARTAGLPDFLKDDAEILYAVMLCFQEQRVEEAEERIQSLIGQTSDPDARDRASLLLATILMHTQRQDEAVVLLDSIGADLRPEAQPFTRLLLEHRRGLAHLKEARCPEAIECFERARRISASIGCRFMEAALSCDLGNALRLSSRPDEAAACYLRAEEGARDLGLPRLRDSARFNLALCWAESGDLRRALPVFEAAAEADSTVGNPIHEAIDRLWLGTVLRQTGDLPEALEQAERGLRLLSKVGDPSIRMPLLVLRGEILLATGQKRKLGFVCREILTLGRESGEPEDRLSGAALRCAAATRGISTFGEEDARAVGELLPQVGPARRAHWHLMSAEAEPHKTGENLMRAFGEALEAGDLFLISRSLWALCQREALPPLDEPLKARLRAFLLGNRIRGPERGLLPHLAPARPEQRASRDFEPGDGDLNLLTLSARGSEEARETLLQRTGAWAGCIVRPGRAPLWWGKATADQRLAMASAAGLTGDLAGPNCRIVGLQGSDGLWCGLMTGPEATLSEDSLVFARLWTKVHGTEGPREEAARRPPQHPAVGRVLLTASPAMEPLLDQIAKAAPFAFPALITGEPGSGKEVVAKALHAASPRGHKEWIPANCANLTPTLAASLLFGHRRGAFTGADRDQAGLVEAAGGSTLFLDEVGELPPEVQANLLRFLQDGTFLPLGEVRPRRSDARVVAATNRNLEEAVRQGTFRADLFHRLNVIRLEVPPLRERPEDVALLLHHFLEETARGEALPAPEVDPAVVTRLAAYPWPGNVRELQNLAKVLLVTVNGRGRVVAEDLPRRFLNTARSVGTVPLQRVLQEAERAAIESALGEAGGVISQAARLLGISRQALLKKKRRLGVGQG